MFAVGISPHKAGHPTSLLGFSLWDYYSCILHKEGKGFYGNRVPSPIPQKKKKERKKKEKKRKGKRNKGIGSSWDTVIINNDPGI